MLARPALALALFVLLFAAASNADPSPAHEPSFSIRVGVDRTQLEGALGAVYPHHGATGLIGAGWRFGAGPWRLRTGLQFDSRAGVASGSFTGIGLDFITFQPETTSVKWRDVWGTNWLELPLVAERVIGRGGTRSYVGAGLVGGVRLDAAAVSSHLLPPNEARHADVAATVTCGLERHELGSALRLELGASHGTSSVYAPGRGPSGSWNALSLTLDVCPLYRR